jgi:hypothetical protein
MFTYVLATELPNSVDLLPSSKLRRKVDYLGGFAAEMREQIKEFEQEPVTSESRQTVEVLCEILIRQGHISEICATAFLMLIIIAIDSRKGEPERFTFTYNRVAK